MGSVLTICLPVMESLIVRTNQMKSCFIVKIEVAEADSNLVIITVVFLMANSVMVQMIVAITLMKWIVKCQPAQQLNFAVQMELAFQDQHDATKTWTAQMLQTKRTAIIQIAHISINLE